MLLLFLLPILFLFYLNSINSFMLFGVLVLTGRRRICLALQIYLRAVLNCAGGGGPVRKEYLLPLTPYPVLPVKIQIKNECMNE